MNKKAIIDVSIAFLVLFVLSYAFYQFATNESGLKLYKKIGDTQTTLTNIYNDAEKSYFFSEQAVKYSLYSTAEKFVKTAGVDESCNGIWKFNTNCDPDLQKYFLDNYLIQLRNYNIENVSLKLEKDIIYVDFPDKVYSNSNDDLDIEYKTKMNFKQDFPINLDEILNARTKLKECVDTNKDIKMCLSYKSEIIKDDFGNEIIYFTIENNKNTFIITDKSKQDKINFRFGINLKDLKETVL